jgi:hypothetical protein
MTSKSAPGQYDAYEKAEGDEPLFTLLARDPVAPPLIEAWAYLRSGQLGAAEIAFRKAIDSATTIDPQPPGDSQIISAFRVAEECRDWRKDKLLGKR